MIYHNNILCVSLPPLIDNGIASPELWKKWVRTGAKQIQKGGNGRTALLQFDTIPVKYQEIIRTQLGSPEKAATIHPFIARITPDEKAAEFYSGYILRDGRPLQEKFVKEYCLNANVLNAVHKTLIDQQQARKPLGGSMKGFWGKAIDTVNAIRNDYNHTLPTSKERLYKLHKQYQEEGYYALISKKFCNDNTAKVTGSLEKLLMSLYVLDNKPFALDVHFKYLQFLQGKIQVEDRATGEVFSPADYKDKKGEPLVISDRTVWNVLNKPHNRAVVDSKRSGSFQFDAIHRPHHHRKAPAYSFSKISLDDRDLPRKTTDGSRVKAYYAYDVASGAVIGAAYSRSKDEELFIECLKETFRTINALGLGMPMEVEVENHLVNKFFDDLQEMFTFLRICNPGNSKEKHAEHFNNVKKYTIEKNRHADIGRWWARSESKRVDVAKVNDEYVPTKYPYERIVADDLADIKAYNYALHSKQITYPGKTRWEVLIENANPNLPKYSSRVVTKAIGDLTNTSIKRNHVVTVQYTEFILSSPSIIEKLKPGNYEVQAYHMADKDGIINEVFIYQDNQFIDRCEPVVRYNTAKGEWVNGVDDAAYTKQAKFVAGFDKMIKEGKKELHKLFIEDENSTQQAADLVPVVIENTPIEEDNFEQILRNAQARDDEGRAYSQI